MFEWRAQYAAVALVSRIQQIAHQAEMKLVGNNPETSLPGVVMEYRAENAFGAIRTESVSAFIVPDDCSVRAIKEYEPSDFQ